MIRRGCFYFLFTVIAIIFTRCKETPGVLSLPGGLEGNYGVSFIDTSTVRSSTVLLDSIPTSDNTVVLLGKYWDEKLGLIEANPYIEFALNSATPDESAVFDSVKLIMKFSGYYYGDTTTAQTIEVREISSQLEYFHLPSFYKSVGHYSYFNGLQSGQISNYSYFSYNTDDILGTATLPRRIAKKDTTSIFVKLNNDFGKDFFLKMREKPRSFKFDYRFIEYFNGLRLNTKNESNIVGLTAANFKIRLYYSLVVGGVLVHKFFDFKYTPYNSSSSASYTKNFTQYNVDRSGTPTEQLSQQQNVISSTLTNNETYIQAGTGVVTKLEIPYLQQLSKLPGFSKISSARLILEPVKDSYTNEHYLPNQLSVYYASGNVPSSPMTGDYNTRVRQAAKLSSHNGVYNYTFSITQLVTAVTSALAPQKISLIISTPENRESNTNIFTTTTRVCLGDGQSKYRARIEVYYLKENL